MGGALPSIVYWIGMFGAVSSGELDFSVTTENAGQETRECHD
jgi:hypothetical protein